MIRLRISVFVGRKLMCHALIAHEIIYPYPRPWLLVTSASINSASAGASVVKYVAFDALIDHFTVAMYILKSN